MRKLSIPKEQLLHALNNTPTQIEAAEALNISTTVLYRCIKDYDLVLTREYREVGHAK